MNKRRKYDQDFKRNAVLLCSEPGRTVSEVALKIWALPKIYYTVGAENITWQMGNLYSPAMVLKH